MGSFIDDAVKNFNNAVSDAKKVKAELEKGLDDARKLVPAPSPDVKPPQRTITVQGINFGSPLMIIGAVAVVVAVLAWTRK